MTGTGGDRDDYSSSIGVNGKSGGSLDPCLVARSGPINSPKASVLGSLAVGSILEVDIQNAGRAPVLVVKDSSGAVGGSLTFVGYLELIDCIKNKGIKYKATVTHISGGVYSVLVDPA
ncbi:hypothetical protein [Methylosinus sp. LW4]|uniref:hypothetical protein n=1 Tax=Methylosinus sp. LW4 TaxID=136993 RepID=UPI00035C2CD6|nr:hypothetical protein [Methylosinus sp. LW4]